MADQDKVQTSQDNAPKPEDKGKTPKVEEKTPEQKVPTPEGEPKTLTTAEGERIAQLARMDAGRLQKAAEIERDAAKSQLTTKEAELNDIADEREKLQIQNEELASGDPAKFDVVKKDRDLRERERKLKADTLTLDGNTKANEEKVTKATETLREISIWEISTNYEGSDPAKLKDICDISGADTEEKIVKVADTLWPKKSRTPETEKLIPFSGKTSGGGGFIPDRTNPNETLKRGFQDLKK